MNAAASLAAGTLIFLLSCGPKVDTPAVAADLDCPDCSLVLISIDTLRADHLGCYRYARDTSPAIDRFAERSLVFERAYSPSYHTADSHMSIFTGTYPSVHRVRNVSANRTESELSASISTLTERLHEGGFATAGFHGGGNVSAPYGFGRGFDRYQLTLDEVEPALDWLRERKRIPSQRFFLFFHTFRTHDPYLPPPPFNRLWLADYVGTVISESSEFQARLTGTKFQEKRDLFWSRVDPRRAEDVAKVVALYDGAIRRVDGEIERLLDEIERLPQPTVVALVSDHGEQFFEHGGKLHDDVWEELLHVPFILRHPRGAGAGKRVPWRVSLVDLAPTLLEAVHAPALPLAQGRSLLGTLRAGPESSGRTILAEKLTGDDRETTALGRLQQALLLGDLKLVAPVGRTAMLFDLSKDAEERIDRSATDPEASRLISALRRRNEINLELWSVLPRSHTAIDLDDETIARLRALGYL